MLPAVAIVLNKRFVPPTPDGPFRVGAANSSLVAAQVLDESLSLLGFLLYKRQEKLREPAILPSHVFEYPACEFDLSLTLGKDVGRSVMQAALEQLTSHGDPVHNNQLPVLYHQTGVFLPFAPRSVRNVVTHHGPFVSDVIQILGEEMAREAFQGGKEKIVELERAQQAGLDALRQDPNIVAFEFSSVQTASLLERGIPQEKIFRTVPPIIVQESELEGESIPEQVEKFLSRIGSALLLVVAAARLDAFKNIALLVDVAVQLKREHADIAVLVAGDGDSFLWTNKALERRIPISQRDSFLFVGSFLRSEMLSVFRRVRNVGVFVLTSIFETFGLTPLEAMWCGLTTIVPDVPRWIGVAEYVPKHLRFVPTFDGLARLLRSFLQDRSILGAGMWVARDVRLRIGYQRFSEDLLRAIATGSESRPVPKRKRTIKAIIFDLDNCLSAADEAGREVFAPVFEAIRRANKSTLSDKSLKEAFSDCWYHPLDVVARKHGFSNEMLVAGWEVSSRIEVNVPMRGYPDLVVLAELPTMLFLVTSGFRRLQESKIRALGFGPIFSEIYVDAIDEANRKGKEMIFREILDSYRLDPEEVLVVGDDPQSEIEIGNQLGIKTVQILRSGVPFGRSATHHVHQLTELKELVMRTTTET